jgi:hypothetical protein
MELYWRTTGNDCYHLNKYHAARIGGFPLPDYPFIRDRAAKVPLSNRPVQPDERCDTYFVVTIHLPQSESELAEYEIANTGKPWREWMIPARLLIDDASVGISTVGRPPPREDRKGRGKRAKSRLD